jgi:hypothetical protein
LFLSEQMLSCGLWIHSRQYSLRFKPKAFYVKPVAAEVAECAQLPRDSSQGVFLKWGGNVLRSWGTAKMLAGWSVDPVVGVDG